MTLEERFVVWHFQLVALIGVRLSISVALHLSWIEFGSGLCGVPQSPPFKRRTSSQHVSNFPQHPQQTRLFPSIIIYKIRRGPPSVSTQRDNNVPQWPKRTTTTPDGTIMPGIHPGVGLVRRRGTQEFTQLVLPSIPDGRPHELGQSCSFRGRSLPSSSLVPISFFIGITHPPTLFGMPSKRFQTSANRYPFGIQ